MAVQVARSQESDACQKGTIVLDPNTHGSSSPLTVCAAIDEATTITGTGFIATETGSSQIAVSSALTVGSDQSHASVTAAVDIQFTSGSTLIISAGSRLVAGDGKHIDVQSVQSITLSANGDQLPYLNLGDQSGIHSTADSWTLSVVLRHTDLQRIVDPVTLIEATNWVDDMCEKVIESISSSDGVYGLHLSCSSDNQKVQVQNEPCSSESSITLGPENSIENPYLMCQQPYSSLSITGIGYIDVVPWVSAIPIGSLWLDQDGEYVPADVTMMTNVSFADSQNPSISLNGGSRLRMGPGCHVELPSAPNSVRLTLSASNHRLPYLELGDQAGLSIDSVSSISLDFDDYLNYNAIGNPTTLIKADNWGDSDCQSLLTKVSGNPDNVKVFCSTDHQSIQIQQTECIVSSYDVQLTADNTADNPYVVCPEPSYLRILGSGFIDSRPFGDKLMFDDRSSNYLTIGNDNNNERSVVITKTDIEFDGRNGLNLNIESGSRLTVSGARIKFPTDKTDASMSLTMNADEDNLPYLELGDQSGLSVPPMIVDLNLYSYTNKRQIPEPVTIIKAKNWGDKECIGWIGMIRWMSPSDLILACSEDGQELQVSQVISDSVFVFSGEKQLEHIQGTTYLIGNGTISAPKGAAFRDLHLYRGSSVTITGGVPIMSSVSLYGGSSLKSSSGRLELCGSNIELNFYIMGEQQLPTLDLGDFNDMDYVIGGFGVSVAENTGMIGYYLGSYHFDAIRGTNHRLITGKGWDCEKWRQHYSGQGGYFETYCVNEKDDVTNMYIYDNMEVFGSMTVNWPMLYFPVFVTGNTKFDSSHGGTTQINELNIMKGDAEGKGILQVSSCTMYGDSTLTVKNGKLNLERLNMHASASDIPFVSMGNFSELEMDEARLRVTLDTTGLYSGYAENLDHELIAGTWINETVCNKMIDQNNRRVTFDQNEGYYNLTCRKSSKTGNYSVFVTGKQIEPMEVPTNGVIDTDQTVRLVDSVTADFSSFSGQYVIIDNAQIIASGLSNAAVRLNRGAKLEPKEGENPGVQSVTFETDNANELPYLDIGDFQNSMDGIMIRVVIDTDKVKISEDTKHVLMRGTRFQICDIMAINAIYDRENFNLYCIDGDTAISERKMILSGERAPGYQKAKGGKSDGLGGGAIAGIVIAVIVVVAVIIIVIVVVLVKRKRDGGNESSASGATDEP